MGLVAFLKHPPLHEPSKAQKQAGNYPKRKVQWRGLTIGIENEQGSLRRGVNRDGKEWTQRMSAPYGEIHGTEGVDGDPVDVFLGPNLDAPTVYVIQARKVNRWDQPDEDKCMVGWPDAESAKAAFLSNYSDPRFFGSMREMPVDEFVDKVKATKGNPSFIKALFAEAVSDDPDAVAKAEQLSLFDQPTVKAPVMVHGSTRADGTTVKPYTRVQHVSEVHQSTAREKLQAVVDRHGGSEVVGKMIGSADPAKVQMVIGMLAHATHLNEAEVRQYLGLPSTETTPPEGETTAPESETTSRDGETKSENGIDYVLKDGHWHRTTPLPDPAESLAEDREDLRSELNRDAHSDTAKSAILSVANRDAATPEATQADDEPDDLDPNSPNYRYRDTGYVAGSRKELAAETIRSARRDGQRLRATDIDWQELEANPREAQELITKSNLFGQVDWAALRTAGMTPAAGFLIDRVYASVATEPTENMPQARRDYALGLETLRDRLERCQTADQVTTVLNAIQDEIRGEILNATESVEYQAALAVAKPLAEKVRAARKAHDEAYQRHSAARALLWGLESEQAKRARRKWKPDPELDAKAADAKAKFAQEDAAYQAFLRSDPKTETIKREHPGGYVSYDNEYEWEARQAREAASAVLNRARYRNVQENPLTRAWMRLGARFLGVINYRRSDGSSAFAGHVTSAKTGKITDWDWAEKEMGQRPTPTKREIQFQLKVAEHFERQGGRPVEAASTASLKGMFNLRDVQSGNWVLKDVASSQFHVQKAAEALADLSDLIGSSDVHVSMRGRLALAFGARGHGNAGFQGAARAHYEPVHRVINLTKMGGGGALGHEWFHAMDNLVREAEGAGASLGDTFLTETPDLLPPGPLRDAFQGVRDAITKGQHRIPEVIEYNTKDFRTAHYNIDRPTNEITRGIHDAKDAAEAVLSVDEYYARRYGEDIPKKAAKQQKVWRRLAVAYHHNQPSGDKVSVGTGASVSSFMREAVKLDGDSYGKYWSTVKELAARGFQAYCEDRLASMSRKNDYLSAFADNKYYVDPIFGPKKPFPEGEERERLNAAYDRLFAVMKERGTLAKAMALLH